MLFWRNMSFQQFVRSHNRLQTRERLMNWCFRHTNATHTVIRFLVGREVFIWDV